MTVRAAFDATRGRPIGPRRFRSSASTALLASVMSLHEARLVADCVDVVDLKDPRTGALGALPVSVVAQIVRWIDGRCATSATIGDPPMSVAATHDVIDAMRATGVDFVKIGMPASSSAVEAIDAASAHAGRVGLVGVLFADRERDPALVERMADGGFAGVMLDTADKSSGSLLHHVPAAMLGAFVERAHALGLFAGLAGALRIDDLRTVLEQRPDYIGFRGALCDAQSRTRDICRANVEAIAGLMRPPSTTHDTSPRRGVLPLHHRAARQDGPHGN